MTPTSLQTNDGKTDELTAGNIMHPPIF